MRDCSMTLVTVALQRPSDRRIAVSAGIVSSASPRFLLALPSKCVNKTNETGGESEEKEDH